MRAEPGKLRNLRKLFRKNVVSPNREPGLGRHFLFVRGRLRHVAKVAIGQETKLVVIIEDDATMARHAEILRQNIARENI